MSDIAIQVDGIGKTYHIYTNPMDRLKDALNFGFKTRHEIFEALRDISFSLNKGETVGIIGTNGSGKSTLLKIIADVTKASVGEVKVHGKISAILELGTGFNPELNGLENIYLNGLILGYSKEEISEKLEDIISFSELGEFINRPVKTYSSGMYARLAFSVAINVDPDILIIDEALSVGDAAFQKKCFTRLKSLTNSGATVLFVSHSLDSVIQLCDRAVLLDKGSLIMVGETKEVTKEYNQRLFGSVNKQNMQSALATQAFNDIKEDDILSSLIVAASKSLDGGDIFKDIHVKVLNKDKKAFDVCTSGELLYAEICLLSCYDISNLSIAVEIVDKRGMLVTGESTFNKFDKVISLEKDKNTVFSFSFMSEFIEDDYFVQVRINRITQKDRNDNVLLYINEQAGKFTLSKNMINRQWFKVKKNFNIEVT
ncbi:ABC transporter ATP-binding protein [Sulfurimonas sp. MAG313]|nr:ABC transporter ATP-binding protein [Sulfurimonas sp. MAG313]MDF1881752.1 ABC transporter ATP-binding protein [Sulfurimonas sp. MAG313]